MNVKGFSQPWPTGFHTRSPFWSLRCCLIWLHFLWSCIRGIRRLTISKYDLNVSQHSLQTYVCGIWLGVLNVFSRDLVLLYSHVNLGGWEGLWIHFTCIMAAIRHSCPLGSLRKSSVHRQIPWLSFRFPGATEILCDSFPDVKESACNVGDLGSIPGLGRSPREGKGYPLQYSGLENSMFSPWDLKEPDTTERLSLQSLWLHLCFPTYLSMYLYIHFDWRDLTEVLSIYFNYFVV